MTANKWPARSMRRSRVRSRVGQLAPCAWKNQRPGQNPVGCHLSCLRRRNLAGFRSRWNPRRQCQDLAFGCAGGAAKQRSIGAIWNGDQVVGTEKLAASIAVKLIAAGAEHLAARGVGAGANFQQGIATRKNAVSQPLWSSVGEAHLN